MAPGQASRDREAVRAQFRAAEATLRLAVTRAYLEVLRQKEGRALAEQEMARAELNLRLARGRQAVGSATLIDVQQGEVGVGRAEIALLQAETGVRNASIRLLEQMGVAIGAVPALTTEFAVSEFEWSADELFERALAQNPDVAALRAREQSALYGVRMARSSYYPSLTLSTGVSGFAQSASSTDAQEAAAKASGDAAMLRCEYENEVVSRLIDPLPTQDCSRFAVTEAVLEGIVLFSLLAVAAHTKRITQRPGTIAGMFFAGYGIARIIAELFREPDAHLGFILGPVTMGQLLSLPLIAIGLALAVRRP